MQLFVPGRLCLFGEHSDWAGGHRATHPELAPGLCLVTGTGQGLTARAERLGGALELDSRLVDGRRERLRLPFRPEALAEAAGAGGFFSYAAGVAAEVRAGFGVGGLRLESVSDLPPGKGLSSSAAVCVLVARAFSRLYDLGLDTRGEMELAYRGERRAGSACGRMDQICAYGQRALRLHFDGEALEIAPLRPRGAFHLLLVDLRGRKDTRRILTDLNACYPDSPGPVARGVREALGPRNAEIVAAAEAALVRGDAPGLGRLMDEAQSVFDALVAPACAELAAPRLHVVLAHPATRELAFGGKGVGSQGDGCAQLVTRGPGERERLARGLEDALGVACLPLGIRPGEP